MITFRNSAVIFSYGSHPTVHDDFGVLDFIAKNGFESADTVVEVKTRDSDRNQSYIAVVRSVIRGFVSKNEIQTRIVRTMNTINGNLSEGILVESNVGPSSPSERGAVRTFRPIARRAARFGFLHTYLAFEIHSIQSANELGTVAIATFHTHARYGTRPITTDGTFSSNLKLSFTFVCRILRCPRCPPSPKWT